MLKIPTRPILLRAVALALAGWLGMACSAQANTLLMVDYGVTGQTVQAGWTEGSGGDADIQHPMSSLSPNPNTVSTASGNITYQITRGPNEPNDNLDIEYRNRSGAYDGGSASYVHPTFGQIGHVIQDEIKLDGGRALNGGNTRDATHQVVLSGMNAGSYELTTFHHSRLGGFVYDWSEFDLKLQVGAGNGYTTVASNLSVTSDYEGGSSTVSSITEHTTAFSVTGPDTEVSLHIATIPSTADGTGSPGSMKGQDEVPLNGFALTLVPEPTSAVCLVLGMMSLLLGCRVRNR